MISVYIDQNVFVNLFEFKFLGEKKYENIYLLIDSLIDGGFLFPYSPAHVEEIELFRVSGRSGSGVWSDQLKFLGQISNEKSCISQDVYPKDGRFVFYDTELCYKNTITPKNSSETMRMLSEKFCEDINVPDKFKFYHGVMRKIIAQLKEPVELSCDLKEMGEGSIQSFIAMLDERRRIEKSIYFLESVGVSKEKLKKIEKLDPSDVFGNDYVIDLLLLIDKKERILEICAYKDDSDSEVFQGRQCTLVNLFDFLNSIGYSKNHNKLKSKNRLHDTSHALCASYADVFVTNDKKLRKQTQAIFSFLGHYTQVISQEEFIKKYG